MTIWKKSPLRLIVIVNTKLEKTGEKEKNGKLLQNIYVFNH